MVNLYIRFKIKANTNTSIVPIAETPSFKNPLLNPITPPANINNKIITLTIFVIIPLSIVILYTTIFENNSKI